MKYYIDAGLVHTAQIADDGRIHFYGRCAKVGTMDYYEWRDAKLAKITRNVPAATLYDPASLKTLEHTYLLNGHTVDEFASPDNLSQVIGHTGSVALPELGTGFLGFLGSITTRDGIDAYNAGDQEISPEYLCDLKLVDGVETQFNRRYKGVSFVPEARGGAGMRIKDSAENPNQIYVDRSWMDDKSLRQLWLADASPQTAELIGRMLGTMPKSAPIVLPSKIKMSTKFKIGTHSIEVEDSTSKDADALSAEFSRLEQTSKDAAAKLADAEAKNAVLAETTAANTVLKDKITELEAKIATFDSTIDAAVSQRMSDLVAANKDCAVFEKAFAAIPGGKSIVAAKDALNKGDIASYKKAIEAEYKAPAGAYVGFAIQATELYGKDAATADAAMIPNFNLQNSQLSEMYGGGTATASSLANFTPGQFANALAPEDPNVWRL
jgi:Uncharacterized protein conserved in bacteria (DUF2213)